MPCIIMEPNWLPMVAPAAKNPAPTPPSPDPPPPDDPLSVTRGAVTPPRGTPLKAFLCDAPALPTSLL